MKTRFKAEQGGNQLPHILNSSGVALARLFVALIETHQQNDNSIKIPEPLQPYLRTEPFRPPSHAHLAGDWQFNPLKTGGLADMVAGIGGALAELSEDVTVATVIGVFENKCPISSRLDPKSFCLSVNRLLPVDGGKRLNRTG